MLGFKPQWNLEKALPDMVAVMGRKNNEEGSDRRKACGLIAQD